MAESVLNPVQLRALTEVVRTGSFTEAGRELGYTSSAVSQQVTALERALGLRLVVREPHRIRCTPAALRLAHRGARALHVLAALEDDVRAVARGRAGRLRIGTSLDPAAGLIAPTLRRLKASHPQVTVTVDDLPPDDLLEEVLAGAVDVALVYDYPAAPRDLTPGLVAVELARDPWELVLPADWRDAHELSDLATHEWVVGLDDGVGHPALTAVCATAGFTPRVSVASRNRDVVVGLVSAGAGIGVLPAVPWRASPGVSLRPFEAPAASRRTLAVHPRTRTDASVSAALRTLHRVARAEADASRLHVEQTRVGQEGERGP